ncbi:hypothetical protein A6R68_16598 [Neotoma lepida]|uniref:Large ribosomal subunit protein mL45 n=1 Tax=Neotoma lepida TaxID=56216 RepID=A0A1A6HFC4_NEOLE|nr:hypothetical protein A6R68_16598 [Neotoma lepida]
MRSAISLTLCAGIFDPYVPPEGDGRMSSLSKEGLAQRAERLKKNDMVWDLKYKTVRWSFVESLEPAQVVHVRSSGLVNQSNMYGQTLAIYDRFGRLMYGQEDVPKDVLEYVVFERHLMNPYGSWRMHAKIVPTWAPPKQPILKTLMIPGPQLNPWEETEKANEQSTSLRGVQQPSPCLSLLHQDCLEKVVAAICVGPESAEV